MSLCIVFVCNQKYLPKFSKTLNDLRIKGAYKGEVLLIIGNDLSEQQSFLETKYNVKIKYFPDIQFSGNFMTKFSKLNRPGHWRDKIFQYHKFHLFNEFFKQWDYIFYLDCGITITSNITPMLKLAEKNTFLAHNDAYPTMLGKWKLEIQFDSTQPEFKVLESKYDLKIDYFQTTIMLFDTSLIDGNTFDDLLELTEKYPISRTNDQGMIALYFICINPQWKQIMIQDTEQYYYDYKKRAADKKYIMHKI